MKKRYVFISILILLTFATLIGQEMIARVRGTVRDQQGNPIPKAKITFIYIQQNIRAETVTDEKGEYIRAGLRPGIYKVIVEAKGYATWTRDDIRIRAGETGIGGVPRLDIILESQERAVKREEAAKAKKNLAIISKEYKEANEAFAAKDFNTAIEKYKKILELDPNQSSSIYNLAMSYINKKMFKEAAETLKRGVEVQPEGAEVNFYLAYSLMMADWEMTEEAEETEKRMKKAEEYFQKSLELGFDRREEAALKAFSKAVELKPDFERALIETATSHVKLNNYQKAKELFEQYLKEYPDGEYVPRAEQMLEALERILEKR